MRIFALGLLSLLVLAQPTHAESVEVKFADLKELGIRKKPIIRISSAQEALDFILGDKIVRGSIASKSEQGYTDWKAEASKLGYDGDKPIFEVRLISASAIPPFSCYFRFDSDGIDHREQPWNGCQYE